MATLNASTCYYPNAAKLLPMGFAADGFDHFGRRQYDNINAFIAVDCAEGASGEVTIWARSHSGTYGRQFTGLLPSEAFFDELLRAVGYATPVPPAAGASAEAGV